MTGAQAFSGAMLGPALRDKPAFDFRYEGVKNGGIGFQPVAYSGCPKQNDRLEAYRTKSARPLQRNLVKLCRLRGLFLKCGLGCGR